MSAQRAADQALRDSEMRFRDLYDNAPVGYCELDSNGYIRRVNKTQLEMLGYAEQEMLGRPIWEFAADQDCGRTVRARIAADVPLAGPFECAYERKDGSTLALLIEERILSDESGQKIGIRCTFQDITDRKQTEERLQEASRLASVGDLAAGLAHEINNPLTSILGFSELLMDENLSEQARSDSQKAAKVVQNLLSFARRQEPQKQYTSITPTIERVLELRSYEFEISNVEVISKLLDNIPNTMVDEHQLLQVLVNLLTNAEQAISQGREGGRIKVLTEIVGDKIDISVSDDGPGVSTDALAKLFDPFYTTKEVGKGTGFGLSLSYGIVQQHGGDLWAETNFEGGMTFHVELPVVGPEGVEDIHEPDRDDVARATKHVLVINDEPSIRELMSRKLSEDGFDVDVAGSAKRVG